MKIDANTIEEFFSLSGEQESDMRALDQLIVETAPGLKRRLFSGPSITMLGYGEMTWMNKSSSGIWPLISLAPQKGNISVYVAAEKDGIPLAQIYDKRLGKVNNGKNCIRFRRLADIDVEEFRNAILDAIEWSRVQERMYGRNCAQPVSGS